MRRILRIVLPVGLVVVSVLVVLALGELSKNRRPAQKPVVSTALIVEVITARVHSRNLIVRSQGSVEPRTETTLVAEVAGTVVSVAPGFNAGGFFEQGETILQIDPSDYLTAQKRAQANLASKHAQLKDQQARADQALRDWTNLGREGKPSDLVLRKPQLAEAKAGVLAAEADLQKADRDLERTRIKLPYNGLVREKKVDIGQYVAPGTPLGVTYSVNTAEVRLPLSAADVAFLDLPSMVRGRKAVPPKVVLYTDRGETVIRWEGRITRTEGVLDRQSRVTYAVAEIIDPYGVLGEDREVPLRFGTFVRAELEGRRADDIVVLPRKVLRNDDTVLLANAERELVVQPVGVLRKEPDWVFIHAGLTDGDQVILTAIDAPIPGTRLTITRTDAGTGAAGSANSPAPEGRP